MSGESGKRQWTQEAAYSSSMELVKHRLLSGGVWSLSGRVTLVFMMLAINALLARLLSPAELGAYFLAYSMVGVGTHLGAMGLTKVAVRFVAESVGLEQYDRVRQAIKLALGLSSLGAVAVGLAYLLFGGALASSLFDSPALAAVAGVTAGWILVSVVQGVLAEVFRGFHDIRMATILGGMVNGNGLLPGGLLTFSLLLLWAFRGEAGLSTVMLLAMISGGVSALLAGFLLRRRMAYLPEGGSGVKLRSGSVMQVAWPLMLVRLAVFALLQSSLWIAGVFLGQGQLALYGIAHRLMVYVTIPLQIANNVTPPMIAEMYSQGRTGDLQRTLRAVATAAGVPAVVALAAFVLFGGPILGFIFGDYYRDAAPLLALLGLGQMVHVWMGSVWQVLTMTGYQVTMMVVVIPMVLLTVAGTIWGAQHYGAAGVACGATIGLVLTDLVLLLAVRKKVGVWTHISFTTLLKLLRLFWGRRWK